ncbi:hypothetical protein GCM10009765_64910 [Fodinicola feengrottensis]|uniref:GlsB/YeaQ/YmgE family stress response membrane protein n=1 Tax=Fodinicola feengrottensis TaxID=435914 RepID=A0ABP4UJ16_9ACTN
MWTIITTIIAGAIIGVLARLVMPGRQAMPWWLTVVVGVVAVLIGYFIAGLFHVASTPGVDWIRWGISLVVCIILVGLTAALYPRIRGGSTA